MTYSKNGWRVEQINLSSNYSIIELFTPVTFINKSLQEIGLRKKMRVTVLAIRRDEEVIVAPGPDEKLYKGDVIVALGSNDDLEIISNLE